ncbi:hypothetical protein [Tenacibaculum sp. 190524A02b]|uniref:hypothetical protein n=1 Tax=Tenacibaculum vairaonense TaxID=3137860 RepID=UPI0031FB7DDF
MSFKLNKLKAGALQYVLIISVIIAITLLAFMSFMYVQRQLSIKHDAYKEAIYNVNNGFDYLKFHSINYNETINKQFSNNPKESTSLQKKAWGLFDIVTITSKINNDFFQKVALMAWKTKNEKSIYLQDNNTPLVLVGKTKIVGDAYLPKQGVKSGNIAGNSFYGRTLIFGRELKSNSILPKLNNLNQIKEIYNSSYTNNSSERFELEEEATIIRSFKDPTFLYEGGGTILLQYLNLKGNIIIQSNTKIKVHSSAKLNDIILIAPEIEILKGVTGNFQAFASKNIIIEENCKLNYPSSLTLYSTVDDKKEYKITIAKNTEIKGTIVYLTKDKEKTSYKPQIKLSEEATIVGEIYSEGNVELLGNVTGSVTTKNFLTGQFGSIYINHIYNGSINVKDLPKQYVGLALNPKTKSVAKWLY